MTPGISHELSNRIRERIQELPVDGLPNWFNRLCQNAGVLPLHSTIALFAWVLNPDGEVLCSDLDRFGCPMEPETDELRIYAALAQGARTYPELRELLPACPATVRQCELCLGAGSIKTAGQADSESCDRCSGMGWHHV